MNLYLSGPMRGLLEHNYPAFNEAARVLRQGGHDVVNPAELADPPHTDWADFLRRDIPVLIGCEGIALLPGWDGSQGARLERHIALELGMQVLYLGAAATSLLLEDVAAELDRARAKHPPIHSLHEGHSVIWEEVDEFWDEVRASQSPSAHGAQAQIRHELIQVAAMALRTIRDLEL